MITGHPDDRNRVAVRRGLDELKPLLAVFASRLMSAVLPGKPTTVGGDVSAIIKTILDNWDLAFASALPRGVRNYLHEVRDIRNRWAHDESFSDDEARRALDTMQLVAKAIGAGAAITQFATASQSPPPKVLKLPAPSVSTRRPGAGRRSRLCTSASWPPRMRVGQ